MISTSGMLVLFGSICLCVAGLMMYKLTPREGKPPSPWVKTDFRATSVALGQFVLLIAGISLLAKGILS